MNFDAMTSRLSVLTRALPMRILLVDDDPLGLELLTERLTAAGFQITRTSDGEQALTQLQRQWHPVVITDWQMPVMDGIAFTEALRARGLEDTYVIMLTMRDANVDYERGYQAGVDDYLTKKVSDAELFTRIHAAFNTLALRRSLKEAQSALEESVSICAQSGAFAPRELRGKLQSELRRAQRYGRQLSVIVVNAATPARAVPAPEVLRGLVQALDRSMRAHVDWVGRLEADVGASFAAVLPEAGIGDAPMIKERMLTALREHATANGSPPLIYGIGVAALDRTAADGAAVEAEAMLEVASHCLNCPGRAGPEQLRAVQRSVASQVAIVCRHGYAVDDECSLKAAGVTDSAREKRVDF